MKKCPECGFAQEDETVENKISCVKCGVIFSKFRPSRHQPSLAQKSKPASGKKSSVIVFGGGFIAFCVFFIIFASAFTEKKENVIRSKKLNVGSSPSISNEWFRGGSLHSGTVAQWNSATYSNKLTTAADWLAGTKWKGHLNSPSDFNRIKRKAEMLVDAVNSVAVADKTGSAQVNEIAAAIIVMSNDIGP